MAIVAIAASCLIWGTARWPVQGWEFSFLDLGYYGRVWEWRGRLREMTGTDAAYMVGLALWALVGGAWILRLTARVLTLLRHRAHRPERGRFWTPSLWLIAWLLIALAGVGMGWPHRIGERWIANIRAERKTPPSVVITNSTRSVLILPPPLSPPDPRPLKMTDVREMVVLRSVIAQGGERVTRLDGLNLVIQKDKREAFRIISATLGHESDDKVKVVEIRLVGIMAEPESATVLMPLLADRSPLVREAAADALGILHDTSQLIGGETESWIPWQMNCDPSISLPWGFREHRQQIPAALDARDPLEKMMLQGPTADEREAAARALRRWPPDRFRLRYAEWGVFMTDALGKLQFIQAQLDEIPPFVHRVGNPAKELKDRIDLPPMPVWKPVIHLTADRPMVVDLQVAFNDGRPWVVYPRIDDLTVIPKLIIAVNHAEAKRRFPGLLSNSQSSLEQLDPSGMPKLTDLRSGYPWSVSRHATFLGPTLDRIANPTINPLHLIAGIGVRWQSIIVSPKRLDWMTPANVADDPRFAWWKRLREVDCSWVSSRGESERFLYYDGPMSRQAPVAVELEKGRLLITRQDNNSPTPFPGTLGGKPIRPGVYIEVTSAGVASKWVDDLDRSSVQNITGLTIDRAEAAEDQLAKELQNRGLTHSEAAGLIDAWRPAFFNTKGQRFLTFMAQQEYDDACPMTIRPDPTEKVRVGIFWTELAP
jgi:hypothetical protein